MMQKKKFSDLITGRYRELGLSIERLAELIVGVRHGTVHNWIVKNRWRKSSLPALFRALDLSPLTPEQVEEQYEIAGWLMERGGGDVDEAPGTSAAPLQPPVQATPPVSAPTAVVGTLPNLSACLELTRVGRYAEAAEGFRRLAEAGNTAAQVQLGSLYQRGVGVREDAVQAVAWYRRAAEAGDREGQKNLGFVYHAGIGVERDYVASRSWLQLAAEQGSPGAMNELGWLYQNGLGVEKDYAAALKWYRESAALGSDNGLNNLGWMHEHGLGTAVNLPEAARCYRLALEGGNPHARSNLARVSRML